ncbi:MAG: class I SAM-dependent methyltransferase [Candidatus Aenigmarchaeota archaeon]|nr:class I SAM-dependent methyltransferase [Candidatus Aenigmarchaeota archaeon]MDI6722201.1 class I SAM-dependent methyltransferase [Candidatus Aenigmarchaeota archaeon]
MVKWTEDFAKEYEVPLIEKEYIIKPAVLKVMSSVKGKKIADLGCGSGYFSRILAKKGARVFGIDKNENQLKIASQMDMKNIRYMKRDITNTRLKPNYFDIVLINFVLVEISSPKTVSKIIKEAHRILKKNGMMVIGEVHPHCVEGRSKIDEMYIIDGNYFDNGAKMKGTATRIDGKKITFCPVYHYTLEFYVNAIAENGFTIKKLLEPEWKESFPVSIVIAANKV